MKQINIINDNSIPTLSLFSGAGGLDIGFHQAGFNILGCVEISEDYCKTLEVNARSGKYLSEKTKIHCMDIGDFSPEEYLNNGIECIIGGPPCQTFSAAGRRSGGVLGTEDPRGKLFEAYCHVLDVLRPKVFVFENVYGLPGANGGEPWREILNSFSSLGYNLTFSVLDSADYGVPQHRERLFIVGSMDGEFAFPEPNHGPDSSSGVPLVTVAEAICDLQDPNEDEHDIGGLYGHLLPLVPEGLNYSFFTREMGYPEPYFAWRSKFHDFLYKADRNAPSRTIKAQPGKFTGPFHWKSRHFTTEELKRIQTFPDDYLIIGSEAKIIEQIGNSVTPRLSNVLAVSVKEQILRPTNTLTYKIRPKEFKSTFRTRQREKSKYFNKVAQIEIAKRFPNVNLFEPEKERRQSSDYVVAYRTFFERRIFQESSNVNLGETLFRVQYSQNGSKIQMEVNQVSKQKNLIPIIINITGLSKYLIHIDQVSVNATIGNYQDMFKVWDMVQEQLVTNSQFFTLIDIYGHYANRGDTVNIVSKIQAKKQDLYSKAISFFGCSDNCGFFMNRTNIAKCLEISDDEVNEVVKGLRQLRFDIRTSDTHHTIRTNEIICTYPFPLLSDKAQLERRLKA